MVRKVFGQRAQRIPSQLLSRRSTLNKALPDVQEADHREVRYDGGTLGQNCIKMFGWNSMLLILKYLAQKDDKQVRFFFQTPFIFVG